MANVNEYKSDLFSMLLSESKYALDVYNALNGSDYDDPGLIKIERLESGYSLSIRNDASFFINHEFNLYEHQSTWCPNMPLRMLLYYVVEVNKLTKQRNLHGRTIVQIPEPRFVVFYNGREKRPEYEVMHLSDAYEKKNYSPSLEVIVYMYNINPGNNEELVRRSDALSGYQAIMTGIADRVRLGMRTEDAILDTLEYCTKNDILADFIERNRERMMEMLTLDYTFERRIELEKQDSLAEGRAEGQQRLQEAVLAIRSGSDTLEKLEAQGFDRNTAQMALSLYETIRE